MVDLSVPFEGTLRLLSSELSGLIKEPVRFSSRIREVLSRPTPHCH
jgi:hypothetical protein